MTDQPRSKSDKGGFAAREGALGLLSGVIEDQEQLSDLLRGIGPLSGLAPADKARAQRLALTTLRNVGRADALISQYVDRLPPVAALNVLRLAVVELIVEGEAPHGVVDSSVSLMRRSRQSRKMSGLANAVLRKVATEGSEIWETLPVPSLPKWLRRRVVHIFNEEIVQSIEAAHLAGAPVDLTPKDASHAEAIAAEVGGKVLPTGSVRLERAGQVSGLPGYEEGHWWVQDTGAALAVKLLAPEVDETVLDFCAAPGGKTMQLAAAGAQVTALDISKARMATVQENLMRTGLEAELVVADAMEWEAPQYYDAILLDAPCSATGTIRRHPDLPFAKRGKDLDEMFALQEAMIDRALIALKPGGRLVYCTCSLLTEEGERQAKTAMARHDLTEIAPDPKALGISPDWLHPNGGIRLRPDYLGECGGMDGFFMISLRKPG
ncbi:transcription antitermination factor NusB [uncultured Litoreibacter sp.]|uniref:RsmB/NOP family class I SAM-dependent RNA methyltransferase n=1 Tax=uncultured Litoreibacter sp. TaxID=1392394 RepID=UPI00261B3D63|nr:transcription antitermination factor NusB [uncultured Litoreibacter sp.]